MKRTYEEILDSMKTEYYNDAGENPAVGSETEKRFEILASELFSLSCYGDYIFKQAFVQTAEGESLDKLGELRGCTRKTAEYAVGELTFCIDEAAQESISVPKGTVCSVSGKPYLQYATDSDAEIAAGELSVTTSATALGTGSAYNAAAATVTVMVNAPVSVAAVTNKSAFSGGFDEESDTAYRQRIIKNFDALPNGINFTSYENAVARLEYITDCKIVTPEEAGGTVNIYVATKNGELTDAQRSEIAEKIGVLDGLQCPYSINIAVERTIELTINITVKTGYDGESTAEIVKNETAELFSALRIGEQVSADSVKSCIYSADGVAECTLSCGDLIGDSIVCSSGEIIKAGEINVSYDCD